MSNSNLIPTTITDNTTPNNNYSQASNSGSTTFLTIFKRYIVSVPFQSIGTVPSYTETFTPYNIPIEVTVEKQDSSSGFVVFKNLPIIVLDPGPPAAFYTYASYQYSNGGLSIYYFGDSGYSGSDQFRITIKGQNTIN